jgi:hypothetical protein
VISVFVACNYVRKDVFSFEFNVRLRGRTVHSGALSLRSLRMLRAMRMAENAESVENAESDENG